MESFCRDVRLCPTRCTRVFHHRTEPNSRNMPRLHEYLVQLHHSSDFRRSIPKRRHMWEMWNRDEHNRSDAWYQPGVEIKVWGNGYWQHARQLFAQVRRSIIGWIDFDTLKGILNQRNWEQESIVVANARKPLTRPWNASAYGHYLQFLVFNSRFFPALWFRYFDANIDSSDSSIKRRGKLHHKKSTLRYEFQSLLIWRLIRLLLWTRPERTVKLGEQFFLKNCEWFLNKSVNSYPGPDAMYEYDLFAVINHEGQMDNGHYTNFARFQDEVSGHGVVLLHLYWWRASGTVLTTRSM